jgi:hypothetical protein
MDKLVPKSRGNGELNFSGALRPYTRYGYRSLLLILLLALFNIIREQREQLKR